MTNTRLWFLLAAMATVAGLSATVSAQDKSAADADKPSVKEQTIYIPYEDLRKVFEREGRGVFLPYDEFLKLWRKARDKDTAPPPDKPPVEFLVSEARNVATVAPGSDTVSVKAQLKIEILKPGWHQVPLRLSDAAVTRASIGGQPAHLAFDAKRGYTLLVKTEGDDPKTIELALEFAKAYTKAPGQNSVAFQSPQAPVSRWEVRLSDPGIKIDIDPLIAATEMPGDAGAGKGTAVLAFVGAAPTVRIGWTPKAEGATGLDALAAVQAEHVTRIEEGVVRTRTTLAYAISRAELPTLVIEVPTDQKVVNVFDPNVRQWTVAVAGATQTIKVQLFEPAAKSQRLVVELEKYDADVAVSRDVRVPLVKAAGVIRQQGLVLVAVAPGLRAEAAERKGLMQVDASELPAAHRKGRYAFSYRYAALPYGLSLKVEKIKPRITVESLCEVRLMPDELATDLLAVYTIERAGVFQLTIDLPPEGEVRQVRGIATAGAAAVVVENHYVRDTDGRRRLVVDLARKAAGRVALTVRLVRRLEEPDLLAPTGKKVAVTVGVPRVSPSGIERDSGSLVVYAPETLRTSAETAGLRSIDVSKALERVGGKSPFARPGTGERPIMAWAYADETARVTLSAERRTPQVNARQDLVVEVATGKVKYEARFYWDIRYGTVKTLRVDVPAPLVRDDLLHNVTQGVREEEITPAPGDLPEGYAALRLTGEKEFRGRQTIVFRWEQPVENLDVGKTVQIKVPRLIPHGGILWGRIILSKAETLDVAPVDPPESLRPIDPQHDIAPADRVSGAARAWEFDADWTLTLAATHYELEDVKTTSIERALIRAVVTGAKNVSVQALYRMRSARQRLPLDLPDGVEFADQPLRVGGRIVSLEKGKDAAGADRYFIPLVGQKPDEPFLVELRYTIPDVGLRAPRIDVPDFPADDSTKIRPAMMKAYLKIYLPEDRVWMGTLGPWTNEQIWHRRGWRTWSAPALSDKSLLNWVAADGLRDKIDSSFQAGGKVYLFSALQPPGPPDGSLTIVSMSRNWFYAIILIVIIGGGFMLLPRRAGSRWLAVGAAAVAVVFAGVFLPTLARQLCGIVTLAGVFVVLVLWALKYILVTRPRNKRLRMPAATPPSTPSVPAAPIPVGPSIEPSEEDALTPPPAEDKTAEGGEDHA
jgi:hypothetical protein